ncbi:MAG: PAS domain S-box protein [Deltaproteobacteria bacterium]|nr:PAS domain S-box protein [Deltaproteobacteria bacterium]
MNGPPQKDAEDSAGEPGLSTENAAASYEHDIPAFEDYALQADGFDDPEEKTSPELLRAGLRTNGHSNENPTVVVFSATAKRRAEYTQLLWHDGWNAVEARSPDELFETCRVLGPDVVLVDHAIEELDGSSLAQRIRSHRKQSTTRVVAILDDANSEQIGRSIAAGYDDFILNPEDPMEVMARATSNLRVARTLAQSQQQKSDAATLLLLSQTLASSLDLQLILHTVSRLITDVIKYERCSIVLIDPDGDEAVMVAASEDRTVRDLRIHLSKYPEVQQCLRSAAPVIIADATQEPILQSVREDNETVAAVGTMALFPIVFEERVTGVLFLRSSRGGRKLNPTEVQFAQTVASSCAVAIRNARLFDTFRDQTERMNTMRLVAERQMESLKKFEDFFEYAADGMAILDSYAEVLYVNREGRRLLGREKEEVRGMNFTDFLVEEAKPQWPEIASAVRHGRFQHDSELYIRRGDGADRIFSISAGGGGQETGLLIVSFRDVTVTREMEVELRTTKEFLENLIDNSVDAIVAADMAGTVMLFNKGAEEVFDLMADEVVGSTHVQQLYPPGVAEEVMRQLRDDRYGGRGRLESTRKEIMNGTGTPVPVMMSASTIFEDGEEVATVGVFSDLRDRLKMERRLSEAQDALTKNEKARVAAELAGMAAHELNQPLTSVLGYAEMLRHRMGTEGNTPKEKRMIKAVDTIFGQAERMAEIVRKIGRITTYETKHYGAHTMMMDLEAASAVETGVTTTSQDLMHRPPLSNAGAGDIANLFLASKAKEEPEDPRAAVVRLDTVDPKPDRSDRQQRPWGRISQEEETKPAVRFSDIRPPTQSDEKK